MLWDRRYSEKEYVYGTDANDFLRDYAVSLRPGKALCLAEGEGRNAVWLAEIYRHGYRCFFGWAGKSQQTG